MSEKRFHTPAEVAEMFGVDAGKVLDWIAHGELQAVNVATLSGGIRPRWRISNAAISQFEASRQSDAFQQPSTPRGRKPVQAVTQYH